MLYRKAKRKGGALSCPLIGLILTAVDEDRTNLRNFPSVLFTKEYRFSLRESFGLKKILRHQYIYIFILIAEWLCVGFA